MTQSNVEVKTGKLLDVTSFPSQFYTKANLNKLQNKEMDKQHFVEVKTKSEFKIFLQWSQSVTYHCFPKIFREKTHFILRILWSMIFFSFASLTFYILVNNVISYYQYQTVTSIQIVDEKPALFPTITICDSNATQQAERLIINISQSFYNKDLASMSLGEYTEYTFNNLSKAVKSVVSDPKYGDEYRKQLGFNLSKIIRNCVFASRSCNFNSDFHWYYHYDFGNCFQFNSGLNMSNQVVDMKTVSFGSNAAAFSFKIGPLSNQNKYPLTTSRGLKIFVHNQTVLPITYDNSISIDSGKDTYIEINRKISSNLPNPYSSCSDSINGYYSEFSNRLKQLNRTYRQNECLGLCLMQKPIEDNCGCFYTALPSFRSSIACTNSTQITCMNEKFQEQLENMKSLSVECVKNSCSIECDKNTFDSIISQLDFPSNDYFTLIQNDTTESNYDIDSYQDFYYSLNFYYSSTEYTYISQSPQMTLINLLSNMGGSLGMFLGMSVFSLIELLEIIIKFICVLSLNKA